eukprot:scaffold1434_cov134-Isochrysis_galbana.AAC.3
MGRAQRPDHCPGARAGAAGIGRRALSPVTERRLAYHARRARGSVRWRAGSTARPAAARPA